MFNIIAGFFNFSGCNFYATSRSVQIAILWRLAVVSFLLAVIAGSVAYYREMQVVGHNVGHMAMDQVEYTIRNSLPLIQAPSKLNLDKLTLQLKTDLETSDFVLIEIYSPEKEEVAEAVQPGIETIDRQAALHGKELLKKEQTTYRNFVTGGNHYVQVFTALKVQGLNEIVFLKDCTDYRMPKKI